jgi:hypothetical protein
MLFPAPRAVNSSGTGEVGMALAVFGRDKSKLIAIQSTVRVLVALLALTVVSVPAHSQVDAGRILGKVVDPTGAGAKGAWIFEQ